MGSYNPMMDRTMLPRSFQELPSPEKEICDTSQNDKEHMTSQNGDPATTNQHADEDIISKDWNTYMTSQNGNVYSGDLSEKCPKRFTCFNIWSSVSGTDWVMGLLGGRALLEEVC